MPLETTTTPEPSSADARHLRLIVAVCAVFGLAIVAVLGIAAWGAAVDFEAARVSLLQSEVNRLRSHALRTVLRIQDLTANRQQAGAFSFTDNDLGWLREHWARVIPSDESRLYGAVISNDGIIVLHSQSEREGHKLKPDWIRRRVTEAGDDVVEAVDFNLTGGSPALDISIPIEFESKEIATYHSGFNIGWFERELAVKRRDSFIRWSAAFAVITVVVVSSGVGLYYVARKLTSLQSAVALAHVRRLADLGQLAGGIAHEIRNPLNAMRLNLHVLKKLTRVDVETDGRTDAVIEETVREIERMDGLLRTMLEYARPERANYEVVELEREVRSVVEFLRPLAERDGVTVRVDVQTAGVRARVDRGRIRQVALNLLKNAMEAVGEEGKIEVVVRRAGRDVELLFADQGPGISPARAERIFDPFYTTKEMGTGLGLTLVKRYVEEAGGTIAFEPGKPWGAVFRVLLPLVDDDVKPPHAQTLPPAPFDERLTSGV